MLDDTQGHLAMLRPTETIRRGTASHVIPSAPVSGPAALGEASALPVRKLSDRWYVVRHKPFEGFRARTAIRRLGYDVHWPRVVVRQPRRNDEIQPLFPGYLFARFHVARGGWGLIHRAAGVVGILGVEAGRSPLPVPVGEVERLISRAHGMQALIDETGDDDAAVLPLSEGTEVMILDPMLMGQRGLLRSDKGGDRVKVLLNLLGADRVVEIERSKVRAA